MIEPQNKPMGSLAPWQQHFVRFLHRLSRLGLVRQLRSAFTNRRLIHFMLERTEVGRKVRAQASSLKFYGHRFLHAQSEQFKSARLGMEAAWQLARFAGAPLLYTVFAVTFFVGLPMVYQTLATGRDWPVLPMPSVAAESYVGLMTTIAQAAAAMLALFFTAVSIVASTTYAKVPTEVRSLVAQDDLNRRYLSLLAHTAATATVGLGLHTLGLGASIALAGYIVVLLGISLLAFLPLGIRTFALFDPSNLTGYPLRAFAQAVVTVTHVGRRWLDPSFQSYANRIAEKQLRLVSDLMMLGINENRPRHDTVLDTAKTVNRLGQFYATKKPTIPSDSFWFTRRPEFKRWDVADSSMTGIALRTGVAPSPDLIPDHSFVEAQCAEMTVECLRHLFTRDAQDDAVNLLLEIATTTKTYAQHFEQQESMQLVSAVRVVVVEHLKTTDPDVEPLNHLKVVDLHCVAALAPILTSGLALSERPTGDLLSIATPLLKLARRGMYAELHPRKVLRDAEYLFHRLEFERAAEGTIRTQPWYVRQIIAFAYAEVIRDVIRNIVATLDREFVAPAADLIAANRPLPAGAWLQRAIEACHKARDRIEELETRYNELKGFQVTALQWNPPGGDDALAEVEAARVKIVRLLSKIVPDLCVVPSGGTLPDLIGQVRAWLAQELIAMMEQKQEQGFSDLFVGYFNASVAIQRHFIEFAQQPGKEDYIRVAMDAALDVLDVSGLALLFSQLDGTRFDVMVASVWDRYFKHAADRPALVRVLYDSIDSKLSLPAFSPSAMQRQEWGERLARAMVDRGIDVDRHFGGLWRARSSRPHPSAVIESVLVSFGQPMQSPHEYFGALYIAERDEAKGIDLPRPVKDCLESIGRARIRQAEFKDDTESEPSES
jgi:hypothetical protein